MTAVEREGLTIGSLFSGIGGLELGLEACGLGPVLWQAESDPYARAVLEHHWPNVRRYNDVREIDEKSARVDVLCGGFPCQPHSLAGARLGTNDARWLWPEFKRIIGVLRPRIVFIENVRGLRTSGLRIVLADLARLGFDAEWGCFPAEDAAAPHERWRLFTLAYAAGARLEGREETAAPWQKIDKPSDCAGWPAEPDVARVADGVPAWAHRLRLLGNACVPAQVSLAFRSLIARAFDTQPAANAVSEEPKESDPLARSTSGTPGGR